MSGQPHWVELHRYEGLGEARTIVTCIAAMEFEVQLRDLATGRPVEPEDEGAGGPYVIDARPADREDLADVLGEIVDEQREFDEFIDRWHTTTNRRMRIFLVVMIILVALLAVFGLLEL